MHQYKCTICGYIYDEAKGDPAQGIVPFTKWEDVPDCYVCPICSAPKAAFMPLMEQSAAPPPPVREAPHAEAIRELTPGEISVICSNLAKGCEKQLLLKEMEAFREIAGYFSGKVSPKPGVGLEEVAALLDEDMTRGFASANAAAKENQDRGALRSLVWSEKVSAMMKALLARYAAEGDAMLENTSIYVCDICGFLYLGDAPPDICPVCKVPSFKITRVERGALHAGL